MWNVMRQPCDKCLTLANKNKPPKNKTKKNSVIYNVEYCVALKAIKVPLHRKLWLRPCAIQGQQCQKTSGNSPIAPSLWHYNMIVSIKKKSQPAILVIWTGGPLLIWRNTSRSRSKQCRALDISRSSALWFLPKRNMRNGAGINIHWEVMANLLALCV